MFQRKPQFAIFCMSSRRISRNGMTIGLNTTYTNINGVEKMFHAIEKPKNINLRKQINFLDDEMSNFKIERRNNLQKLHNEHQKNLQRCNSQYLDLRNLLENLKIEENDKKIKEKEEELQKIRDLNKNMDLNRTNLNDTFMFNEKRKITKNFNERKKEIKKQYHYEEPQLKSSKINEQKKQNYIKNIKRLNTYSNNPNFNNVINNFQLNSFFK